MEVMASGLLIPEGPVALSDGSALVVELGDGRLSGEVAATASGHIMPDSFAVEAGGHVCIGSIGRGGITIVDPAIGLCGHMPIDDRMVTNIAFRAEDCRDVWITAAGTGRLLRGRSPRPGLPLAFVA